MSLRTQHFLLSYLKTLSVGPAEVWGQTSGPADRRSAYWANQAAVSLKEPLRKIMIMDEGQTNAFVEGAAYCVKKNVCGKTLIKQDRFTQNRKKYKDLWYQVKKHIFHMYVPSLSFFEYVVASLL